MSDDADVWRRHLAAIAAEGITAKAYAEREGLAVQTVYAWRQRLKWQSSGAAHHWTEVRQIPAADVVVAGASSCAALALPCRVRLELAEVPAPGWVAALALALREVGH